MHASHPFTRLLAALLAALALPSTSHAQEGERLQLDPSMLTNEAGFGDPTALVDEQSFTGPYTAHSPEKTLNLPFGKRDQFPAHFHIDFGETKHLSQIALYDMGGRGELVLSIGEPGDWKPVLTDDGVGYNKWKPYEFLHTTRYLRITKKQPEGAFGELLVWQQTPEQRAAMKRREEALEQARREKDDREQLDVGAPFGDLPLIQEVLAGKNDADVAYSQSSSGATRVAEIFGKPMRVMEHKAQSSYFAYRLGKHKLLEPGKAYLLTVEFPEDTGRSFSIANRGGEFIQGVYTGDTLGDVIFTYSNNNVESIDVPLSGQMRTFRQMFYLSDRTDGIRLKRNPDRPRPNDADDGFWVVFSVPTQRNAPASAGAAVWRIRLFEVPNPQQYDQALTLPPEELPHRHVFAREEMGDSVINARAKLQRAVDDPMDFYRHKIRLHKFLGMNTLAHDLLEFGATQGWDSPSNDWYYLHKFPTLWRQIVKETAAAGLNVLPYYEYAGSKGRMGLGFEQRAKPLSGHDDYTHVTWTENARADLTDPDTLSDIKKVLEETIIQHKDKGSILGAWLRPRASQLPISFADATRRRFAEDTGREDAPTRNELKADESLKQAYYEWWFAQRKAFLTELRDYLRSNGLDDATILYTASPREPGPSIWETGWGNTTTLVTDQPDKWRKLMDPAALEHVEDEDTYDNIKVMSYDRIAHNGWQARMAQRWLKTWAHWEWDHAAPPADPQRYVGVDGIHMTYPFNRLYTVADGSGIADWGGDDKSIAAIRHYPLNENTRGNNTGYFVADYERAGPYSMLEEAMAVAHGDVRYLGYLSAYNFSTGFPHHARRFYANFLALPALPSVRVTGRAADHSNVVVRRIDTEANGTYYAVVNIGLKPARDVPLNLPGGSRARRIVDDAPLGDTLNLDPAQLVAVHVPAQ